MWVILSEALLPCIARKWSHCDCPWRWYGKTNRLFLQCISATPLWNMEHVTLTFLISSGWYQDLWRKCFWAGQVGGLKEFGNIRNRTRMHFVDLLEGEEHYVLTEGKQNTLKCLCVLTSSRNMTDVFGSLIYKSKRKRKQRCIKYQLHSWNS